MICRKHLGKGGRNRRENAQWNMKTGSVSTERQLALRKFLYRMMQAQRRLNYSSISRFLFERSSDILCVAVRAMSDSPPRATSAREERYSAHAAITDTSAGHASASRSYPTTLSYGVVRTGRHRSCRPTRGNVSRRSRARDGIVPAPTRRLSAATYCTPHLTALDETAAVVQQNSSTA